MMPRPQSSLTELSEKELVQEICSYFGFSMPVNRAVGLAKAICAKFASPALPSVEDMAKILWKLYMEECADTLTWEELPKENPSTKERYLIKAEFILSSLRKTDLSDK